MLLSELRFNLLPFKFPSGSDRGRLTGGVSDRDVVLVVPRLPVRCRGGISCTYSTRRPRPCQ